MAEHELEDVAEHGAEGGVCSLSFAASTPVLTPTGERAIASLKVGDHVTAYDPATGKASTQTVLATFIDHDTNLVDVTLKVSTTKAVTTGTGSASRSTPASSTSSHGEKPTATASTTTTAATSTHTEVVHTTANHPWLSAEHSRLIASFLHAGEPVQRADSSIATVVSVRSVPGAAAMWDLTVSQVHTFAVGSGAYVVHNCGGNSAKVDFNKTGSIQHEMKHANDFGVSTHNDLANRNAFVDAMKRHMDDPGTTEIQGYYGSGGRQAAAVHYYNPNTGLNVFAHADGKFWGAWKLGARQAGSLLATGGFY